MHFYSLVAGNKMLRTVERSDPVSQRARSARISKAPGGKAKTPSLLIGRRGRAVEATEERAPPRANLV